ncbi:MAG: 4Fe-4S ferredoxin [Chlamydiae bacterium]|nr:4Fe-4S ferredoxin [Chlamydiota bacterium]
MKHKQCCPGSSIQQFSKNESASNDEGGKRDSMLRQWPVQLHLVSPEAPYFQNADLLLSADCVSYAVGDFHKDHLKNKSLAIACPKLDTDQEEYVEKLALLIDEAKINTLTIMIMQVPCCRGLLNIALQAINQAKRKIPVKSIVVSLQGEILQEEWVS